MAGARNRAREAGLKLDQAIIEMVHLMYQNNTARSFYQGLRAALGGELERRKITS